MASYLFPIKMALLVFPPLALVITIPFLVLQYRRYGALTFWRAFVLYTFVFYLLSAYFLIILPLPTRTSVALLTTPKYNLQPLMVFRQFFDNTVLQPLHPSTYLPALKQPGFTQPFFNLVLTIPFGIYLRYYFQRSLKQTILLSFCLTLFFETTQLTGLYGLYVRPYRLFDVDDLLINTLGGILGYFLAPIFIKLFPSYSDMSIADSKKGKRVSYTRRFIAFIIDWGIVLMATVTSVVAVHRLLGIFGLRQYLTGIYIVMVLGYFVLIPLLTNGMTIGKWFVRIQMVSNKAKATSITAGQLLVRQSVLYLGILPVFVYWFPRMARAALHAPYRQVDFYLLLTLVMAILAAVFCVHVLVSMLFHNDRLIHERLSHTKQISTVTTQNR
ncbi:antibiotic resistance protein VanZ [Loigolactobacillus backii]|uniref:VanZ family protein n=1 Tax=Loigolactobacillus backii TaxID=375175 RepID=UPI000C1CB2C4|nr:VanZ family protein [Loigolactobacillus backii]PIO82728.1 antibiotic resistance protein VanZ [Loigolactobacillus backii]